MYRQIPARDAQALKTATALLVDKAGGVGHAAQLTGLSQSRVSEAQSPYHDSRWLSLVAVADLECAGGSPVVTRALAAMAGFELVPAGAHRPEDFHQHLAHIVMETSDVSRLLANAMADGGMSPQEARVGCVEAQQAIDRLQALLQDFKRVAYPDAAKMQVVQS